MTLTLRRTDQARNEAPPIKPYKEALDFQRKRTPLMRKQFYSQAMDAARPRAFTVTGITRYSTLLAAHRLGELYADQSMSDYADALGALMDEQGGAILSPERLELIHHNTMVNNVAAGAWRQMTDPEFVEDRPYFQYQGPTDGKISRICRPIHMLIVHYKDAILRHMWHPNHHWERHQWVSLAKDAVDPKDVYVSPEGYEYPVVNGQRVTPAPGWDFHPAEAMAADDSAFRSGIEALGGELPAKTPADYGLGKLNKIAPDDLPLTPPFRSDISGLTEEEEWDVFRSLAGIPAGAERALLTDYANDGVWINRDTFEHLGAFDAAPGSRPDKANRLAQVPALLATLADPAEVWWVPRETSNGVVFVKRYFGAFKVEGRERPRMTVVFLERSPEGLAWRSGWIKTEQKKLERLRRGLLVYSKVPKDGDGK
jgi:hypothetical protein